LAIGCVALQEADWLAKTSIGGRVLEFEARRIGLIVSGEDDGWLIGK